MPAFTLGIQSLLKLSKSRCRLTSAPRCSDLISNLNSLHPSQIQQLSLDFNDYKSEQAKGASDTNDDSLLIFRLGFNGENGGVSFDEGGLNKQV